MKIEQDIPLRDFTTFKIGGNTRFYTSVASVEDLKAAVAYAAARQLKIFVLGGGSNILVSDSGFSGLVIKMNIKGITDDIFRGKGEVVAHAGDVWDEVVAYSVERGLSGLENLSLIPGTVGGAVVQNIGAYGSELKDTFVWADVFDTKTGQIRRIRKADGEFGYRTSFFKTPEGRNCIVVKAAFGLVAQDHPKLVYRDVIEYFAKRNIQDPSLAHVREAVIAIRTAKLPDLKVYGTAGSFFKNPLIDTGFFDHLKTVYPDLPSFPAERGFVKIPAGFVIDHICKMKGYREGDIGTFEKQALVLVNHGSAKASDVDTFAKKIVKTVFDATGITLEREVESV